MVSFGTVVTFYTAISRSSEKHVRPLARYVDQLIVSYVTELFKLNQESFERIALNEHTNKHKLYQR